MRGGRAGSYVRDGSVTATLRWSGLVVWGALKFHWPKREIWLFRDCVHVDDVDNWQK